jgi:2-hydroxy-6-oxonona-2,4-dienedioate hydrolase
VRAPGSKGRAALTALEPRGRPRTARGVGGRDARHTVESVWTDVGGLRMHARVALDAAPPHARDVVLVHGLVISSRYMVPLALELAPDLRVHAPDLPGFGLSDPPAEPLDVAGLAEALLAWIDRRGIDRPVLVANSFGCQVAVEALARRPQRFESAVLQGPAFDGHVPNAVGHAVRWLRTGLREPLALNAILVRDHADCGPPRAGHLRAARSYPLEERLGGVECRTRSCPPRRSGRASGARASGRARSAPPRAAWGEHR